MVSPMHLMRLSSEYLQATQRNTGVSGCVCVSGSRVHVLVLGSGSILSLPRGHTTGSVCVGGWVGGGVGGGVPGRRV